MAETIHLTVQEQGQQVPMTVEEARIIEAISPEASVERVEGGVRFTVTDYEGTTSEVILDGEKGDPGDPGEKGDPGDPAGLIDDTSTTATDRTWSAYKLNNAIDAKQDAPSTAGTSGQVLALDSNLDPVWTTPTVPVTDVQVNGTSILSQGVANVPKASDSNTGVVKTNGQFGLSMRSSPNDDTIMISKASNDTIKSGNQSYQAIVPTNQHVSTFYGLAKLAGADMASVTGETVGVYPSAQLVAIQKMLGIYQAPWELIRSDTVTNETADEYIITVDDNGQPFELTDVFFVLYTPKQETQAALGSYGRVYFHYNTLTSLEYETAYLGTYTQQANADGRTSSAIITQMNGMRKMEYLTNMTTGGDGSPKVHACTIPAANIDGWRVTSERIYKKITIPSLLGTANYTVYGRRKWT